MRRTFCRCYYCTYCQSREFSDKALRPADSGKTWSVPHKVFELSFDESWCTGYPGIKSSADCTKVLSGWAPYSPSFTTILRTKDGHVHLMGPALSNSSRGIINHRDVTFGSAVVEGRTVPAPILKYNIAIRSTDPTGEAFGNPMNIDGITAATGQPMVVKEASEVSSAEMANGDIMVLVRPNVSPFMWEGRSTSGGKSWDTPLTRGRCVLAVLLLC